MSKQRAITPHLGKEKCTLRRLRICRLHMSVAKKKDFEALLANKYVVKHEILHYILEA